MTPPQRPRRVLPLIVFSQLATTALWFAGNAVLPDLQRVASLDDSALASITSAVQLGFITGTLLSATLLLADRFHPRRLFFACAIAGALTNLAPLLSTTVHTLLLSRFLTGLFLAGIYPIGMAIAASHYQRGLGRAIGYLVGALVLGTALPHLIRSLGATLSWQHILIAVSTLATTGGVAMLLGVPDGAHASPRKRSRTPGAIRAIAADADFRAASFGYFGHMWELYTVWAFAPLFITCWATHHGHTDLDTSFIAFAMIASGALGCIAGGILSEKLGSARVAAAQLATSLLCCLLAPLVFMTSSTALFVAFLIIWGITVVGDSPQLSTLNARTAPPELIGSALTLATSVGFALTIASIALTSSLRDHLEPAWLLTPLAIGPVLGLLGLRRLVARGL